MARPVDASSASPNDFLLPSNLLVLPRLQRMMHASVEELIGFQKSIEGSPIGSPGDIAEMLKTAVEHGVSPRI